MEKLNIEKAQSHELLAYLGKKVLRPGGKELTKIMIDSLKINHNDDIAEFAPGLGYTASIALKNNPKSYVGIDSSEEKIIFLEDNFKADNIKFIKGNAAETGLPDESKDKVYGEAMLSMHADHRKSGIIKEAHRILKKGGLYAIHELELSPSDLDEKSKAIIQKDLAIASKVNARPMTEIEWTNLLKEEGFKVMKIERNPMHILKPARMIDDEGLLGVLKIGAKVLSHSKARKRVLELRKVFKKHRQNMNAIAILAEKI